MSKIDDLIKELCPKGVHLESLQDVALIEKGIQVNRETLRDEFPFPVFNGGINASGRHIESNYSRDTITISQGGASAGFVNFVREDFWLGAHCYALLPKESVLNRFLFFVVKNSEEYIRSQQMGAGIPALSKETLSQLKVPVPPIEVQREIVSILDKFTELEAELEAELAARREQFLFLRSGLFKHTEMSEAKSLDEVCMSITAGGDLPNNIVKGQKSPSAEHPYPVISNGKNDASLYGYSETFRITSEAITVSARGTIGFHKIQEPKFTPIVRLLVLIPNSDIINIRYLNYALDINPITGDQGGIPQLTVPTVKRLRIPFPSMEEQIRIADILDKFQSLIDPDLGKLPIEIRARQMQYEYYRDKLLTFKEFEAA